MSTYQEDIDLALSIRDEVTKVIRSVGKAGYSGEKVDIPSAQEIAEKLIGLQYLDLGAVRHAITPIEEEA